MFEWLTTHIRSKGEERKEIWNGEKAINFQTLFNCIPLIPFRSFFSVDVLSVIIESARFGGSFVSFYGAFVCSNWTFAQFFFTLSLSLYLLFIRYDVKVNLCDVYLYTIYLYWHLAGWRRILFDLILRSIHFELMCVFLFFFLRFIYCDQQHIKHLLCVEKFIRSHFKNFQIDLTKRMDWHQIL